jgi:hypothetical protein
VEFRELRRGQFGGEKRTRQVARRLKISCVAIKVKAYTGEATRLKHNENLSNGETVQEKKFRVEE